MALASMLRDRRHELGFSLRDVESKTLDLGRRIRFTTLGNIERGRVEPGVRRLHTLMRLYDLSPKLIAELVELEEFAGEKPPDSLSPQLLYEEGRRHWNAGNLREALAHLFELRSRGALAPADQIERQKSLVFFSVAVGGMGKHSLARLIIEDLLLEGVDPSLLVPALVQEAACWHSLGQKQMAIAVVTRAESLLKAENDATNRAWVFHLKASVLSALGDPEGAELAAASAVDAYRTAGDAEGEIRLSAVTFNLLFERGEFSEALRVARDGRLAASKRGNSRLEMFGMLGEGRALLALSEDSRGFQALSTALSKAIANGDEVVQFYAHYHLWKAYSQRNDRRASDLELHACQYHLKSIDEATPEVVEVRATLK